MKYILISVIDREIYTEQFDDLDKAKEALAKELKENLRDDHEDDMYGLSDDKTDGWVTDGLNNDDCDFKIVEIKQVFEFRSIQNGLSFRRIFNGQNRRFREL